MEWVGVTETNRYIHLVQDMQDVMGTWRRVQEPKCYQGSVLGGGSGLESQKKDELGNQIFRPPMEEYSGPGDILRSEAKKSIALVEEVLGVLD